MLEEHSFSNKSRVEIAAIIPMRFPYHPGIQRHATIMLLSVVWFNATERYFERPVAQIEKTKRPKGEKMLSRRRFPATAQHSGKVKEQFWSRISAGLGSALAKWPTAFCPAPEFTLCDYFARRYRNPKLLLVPFPDIHCAGNCFKSGSP